MGNLIPFTQRFIAGISTRTVSARKLHEFLEVKRDFSTWIKARIDQYEFEENTDYLLTLTKTGELKNKGLQGKTEYFLIVDMAKELAMVERNKKGKQARRYFIDCERKLIESIKQKTALPEPKPTPTLHAFIEDSKTPLDLEAILYRSYHQLFGIRVMMVIENGKVMSAEQLNPGEIVFDVAKLEPIFNSVAELKRDDHVFFAGINAEQAKG